MKLSTANLAVLIVTPSTFALIPYIVIMPIKIVRDALITTMIDWRINPDNLEN